MTTALCLNCGELKWGALLPCRACGLSATGNPQLDIAFSDHNVRVSTLKALGAAMRRLREVCGDDKVRYSAFLQYVSVNYPKIISVRLEPEMDRRAQEVLARLDLPERAPPRWWEVWRFLPMKP